MKSFSSFVIVLFSLFFIAFGENIVEKVEVDWWIVPFFAIDNSDNPIMDMEKGDIKLFVDGKRINEFVVLKREFNSVNVRPVDKKVENSLKKKNIILLIIDIAFQSKLGFEKSKEIASDIIKRGSENSLFVLMTVDFSSGLQYVYGPSNDKKKLISFVLEKILMFPETRDPSYLLKKDPFGLGMTSKQIKSGVKISKFTPKEKRSIREQLASEQIHANKRYFDSFKTLYYSLNQITDNKFIYFFSEGLASLALNSTKYARGEFYKGLKKSALFLGKSGSVIFIVDPRIPGGDSSQLSGSDSLKTLAIESGGKYLRGNRKDISKRIEKMNRAYYEIAFSSADNLKRSKLMIEIRSKRKGVKIHSLRVLEKRKQYNEMEDVEKEVLALNLLKRNIFFKSPLKIEGFDTLSKRKGSLKTTFRIQFLKTFERQNLDFFIVRFIPGSKMDVNIKKERKLVTGRIIDVKVDNKELDGSKFVFIDEKNNVAYVDGVVNFGKRLLKRLDKMNKRFDLKLKNTTAKQKNELKNILQGVAEYCIKLENSVFHFICKENIEEILKKTDMKKSAIDYYMILAFDSKAKNNIGKRLGKNATNRIKNDYQLIYDKGVMKEQRKSIGGSRKKSLNHNYLNTESFLAKKIILTPISLLGYLNQEKYKFRYVKSDRINGAEATLIEVFPRKLNTLKSVFGKIWIDKTDNSILRIQVNPLSIGGFKKLMKFASMLHSTLDLKCIIDFGLKRNGIRYPTKVRIHERYFGGKLGRGRAWERSKITYEYNDYQFFNVDTEVKIQK